jgi:hypothetical protein
MTNGKKQKKYNKTRAQICRLGKLCRNKVCLPPNMARSDIQYPTKSHGTPVAWQKLASEMNKDIMKPRKIE